MCLFEAKVAVKRVTRFSSSSAWEHGANGIDPDSNNDAGYLSSSPYARYDALLSGDAQCRACFDPHRPPHSVNAYEREMLENACIAEGEGCR